MKPMMLTLRCFTRFFDYYDEWSLGYLVLIVTFLQPVNAGRSRWFDIPGRYCGLRAREIDGAIVHSSFTSGFHDDACALRFESDDSIFTTKRLMLNVRQLNITDCSVSLSVFFDYDATGTADVTLGCSSPKPPILYTNGKYVTLRLDRTKNAGYDFEIVITSFKSTPYCRSAFRCRSGKCVDRDIVCDGVDNCFDNSDEASCMGYGYGIYSGRGVNRIMFPSVLSTVIFIVLIATIVLTVYARRRRRNMLYAATRGQMIALQQQPLTHTVNPQSVGPPDYSTATQMPLPPPTVGQPPMPAGAYPQQMTGGYPMYPPSYPVPPPAGPYPPQPMPMPPGPGYQS